MSLKAYKATQTATEDPRLTEYRLFGQVTGALLNAKQSNAVGAPLVEAVDWNFPLTVEQAVLMGRATRNGLLPWL